jgi:hypothetical protein
MARTCPIVRDGSGWYSRTLADIRLFIEDQAFSPSYFASSPPPSTVSKLN